jgi:hypothetical protein
MRNYLKNNLEPILIGFALAIVFIYVTNTISDVVIKIAILTNK